jgi:hypothetical protein
MMPTAERKSKPGLAGYRKTITARQYFTGPHVGISPVCLVHLVSLVDLVYLVSLVQPNRRDRPYRPNRPHEQDRLADFISI